MGTFTESWQSQSLEKINVPGQGINRQNRHGAVYEKFYNQLVLSQKLSRSTHYHASYARPLWRKKLQRSGRIGQHIFYVSSRAWL